MNGTFGNVYEHWEWARAYATLELPGTYYLPFRDLAAVRFDNMPTEEKAEALSGLRTLLAPGRCLLLVVSSIAIYVNEWASFSTRDFSENRHASDGDRVRIIMLDVPNCCPVEDAVCTDAHYRHLLESAGL